MIWWILLVSSFVLILYHYILYPITLAVLNRRTADSDSLNTEVEPEISIIIMAHNEEDTIRERIENCFELDYPRENIEIIVASDGSTDNTVSIVESIGSNVRVVDNKPQNKSETRNIAVGQASHDIVFFTDADTRYRANCIKNHLRHYSDPNVGAVCGSLVTDSFEDGAIGEGMGAYWQWEYFMRKSQSDLGVLTKMSGANMSMRTSFYAKVDELVDIDQVAGFDVVLDGGQCVYDPQAVAYEEFPTSLGGELATRKRLTIRALTGLLQKSGAFNLWARPFVAVNTFSYRLLRYLIPLLLLILLVSSGVLASSNVISAVLFAGQALFYTIAGVGYFSERFRESSSVVSLPFSYCWANVGVLTGLLQFLSGTRLSSYESVS